MKIPKVSVLIPAYNAATSVVSCVESVLNQDYQNIEIIVIDDGSTDQTESLLAPYTDQIIYLKKTHAGLGSARNFAHQHARGEYIAWLDSDDIAHLHRISLQVAILEQNPSMAMICGDFSAFRENGDRYAFYADSYYSQLEGAGRHQQLLGEPQSFIYADESLQLYRSTVLSELVFGNFIHPPTVMFRAQLLASVKPMNETIRSSVDWLYLTRLARHGELGFVVNELIDYRLSDSQISSAKANPRRMMDILNVFNEICSENPDVMKANPERHARVLAEFQINAANSLIDVDKMQAAGLLKQSMTYSGYTPTKFKIFIKLLTPRLLLTVKRRLYTAPELREG